MNRRDLLNFMSAGAGLSLTGACSTSRSSTLSPPVPSKVSLGIDRVAADGFPALKGRRVGFITNQTSVDGTGTPSRVVLQKGLGANLVSLFGPEHGLDTRAKAGDLVANADDPLTGLRAYSLYGETRKPTPAMLADVDVLVFDIQDIGVRSYTYISTMALAMEACGQAGKDFVVLDRPNPLGGVAVQGPPMDERFRSFVGQILVPYRHGMTIGELAKMIVARNWIAASPRLSVIELGGWKRSMIWEDTGLNWVPTSPNIPYPQSPFYCATTGILGELKDVDIGIGTNQPFHYAAAMGVDGQGLASYLTTQGFAGVSFLPYLSAIKPGYSGVEIIIDPRSDTDLMGLSMVLIQEIVRRTKRAPLRASGGGTKDLFNKVYGNEALWTALEKDTPVKDLIDSWAPSIRAFKAERAPFLLYG
jgi:uncharacterized protein YbbC (DUF1343 family)